MNAEQLARFARMRQALPAAPTSIGNSAGTLLGRRVSRRSRAARHRAVRRQPVQRPREPMECVATLTAPILQIREIGEPQTVGYGATYVASPPARLAVVGIGYADGYPRSLGNFGAAAVHGRRVPVVGRVSMDLICVDVAALPRDQVKRRRRRRAHRPDRRRRRGRGRGRHHQLRDPDRHWAAGLRASTSKAFKA